jgi:hypothetical protein
VHRQLRRVATRPAGGDPRPRDPPAGHCGEPATAAAVEEEAKLKKPDASLPDGWAGQRGSYELTQLVPLGLLLLLGLLFYAAGTPTRRRPPHPSSG